MILSNPDSLSQKESVAPLSKKNNPDGKIITKIKKILKVGFSFKKIEFINLTLYVVYIELDVYFSKCIEVNNRSYTPNFDPFDWLCSTA